MTKRARAPQYADGLMDALVIVAEVSGPVKMTEFNDATWKMICGIQERLAAKAADAFRNEVGDGEYADRSRENIDEGK